MTEHTPTTYRQAFAKLSAMCSTALDEVERLKADNERLKRQVEKLLDLVKDFSGINARSNLSDLLQRSREIVAALQSTKD